MLNAHKWINVSLVICTNCVVIVEVWWRAVSMREWLFLAQISLFYTDGHDEDKIMFLKFLNLKVVNFFWKEMFLIILNLKVVTLPLLSAPPPPSPPPPQGCILLNVARVSRGYWCGLKKKNLWGYTIFATTYGNSSKWCNYPHPCTIFFFFFTL